MFSHVILSVKNQMKPFTQTLAARIFIKNKKGKSASKKKHPFNTDIDFYFESDYICMQMESLFGNGTFCIVVIIWNV